MNIFTLNLNDVERCALKYSFDENYETLEKLGEGGLIDKIEKFFDKLFELPHPKISFELPEESDLLKEFQTIFCQMAKTELKRLKNRQSLDSKDEHCHHNLKEHVQALENIIEKLDCQKIES